MKQAEIKISGRNTNNLRYAGNTTPMAESKEELKSLLMIVKEKREKVGFKLKIQKTICFYSIDYAKAFDCVAHTKLWKILKEMGIPDHLTCLLRNLYAGQNQQLELGMEQ